MPGLAILLVPRIALAVYGLRAVRAGVRAGGWCRQRSLAFLGVGAVVLTVVNLWRRADKAS